MKPLPQLVALLLLPTACALADADVAVSKTVNNELPAPGEPVEFTIDATNVGDAIATGVVVNDLLPSALEIPAGTAAFPSAGTYDPNSGEWLIGTLEPGQTTTLVLPAVVTQDSEDSCIVNTAFLGIDDIVDDDNDEATALVRRNPDDHCVDIGVEFTVSTEPPYSVCDAFGRYDGSVTIENTGPDAARLVTVSMSWDPDPMQSVRFSDPDCGDEPGPFCTIESIAPGELYTLNVTSDDHQSYLSQQRTLTISVSTGDVDYDLSNNGPSLTRSLGGFSRCVDIDIDVSDIEVPGFPVGPACFIATAAYGTPFDARIDVLRDFRDEHLLTNRFGRALVAFYYEHSPPAAEFIATRDWLRAIVRCGLAPIVFAIEHPVVAAALLVALLAVPIARRRRRTRRFAD